MNNIKSSQDKILSIVSYQYNVPLSKITLETRFNEDLLGDSLDLIETVMEVEDEFNVYLTDEMAENFKKVGDTTERVGIRLQNFQSVILIKT